MTIRFEGDWRQVVVILLAGFAIGFFTAMLMGAFAA